MAEQPHAADGEFEQDKKTGHKEPHKETVDEKKKREEDERKKAPEHR
jgi:hypothetical protein